MIQDTQTAAIILAAGSSSRMGNGRHKLLLPLGNRPVLMHVIEAALASQARPIVLVLGHQAEQVRTSIATTGGMPAVQIIENPAYLQGMSTSLYAGIQALLNSSDTYPLVSGTFIMLGDQPLMTSRILNALIAIRQATGKRIVAPLYDGKRGNPVLFDASLFPALLETTGDEGGRKVIEQHSQETAAVELGNATACYDVDTWDAYQQVVAEWQRRHTQEGRR